MSGTRLVLEFDSPEEAALLNDLVMFAMVKLVPFPTRGGEAWGRLKAAEKEARVRCAPKELALALGQKMNVLLHDIALVRPDLTDTKAV